MSAYQILKCNIFAVYVMLAVLISSCKIVPLPNHDLESEDFANLKSGKLLMVKDRFEKRGHSNLNDAELSVLCDIYIKYVVIYKARICLEDLEQRTMHHRDSENETVSGKKALIALMLGDTESAKLLTKDASRYGSRYVNALAQTMAGNIQPASELAENWAYSFTPQTKFLAASLFVAVEDYQQALNVLLDSEPPRLSSDYSVTGGTNIVGARFRSAPLRLDLFDDFGFGFLGLNSFAPPANVYVEYLIAKSMAETGKTVEARIRLQAIINYPMITVFRDIHWRSLHERGKIAEQEHKTEAAIAYYKSAIEVIESMRASISTEAGRIGFVGDKQETYKKLINLLLKEGKTNKAFLYVERSRARTLVDLLVGQEEFGGRGSNKSEFSKKTKRLSDSEGQVHFSTFLPSLDERKKEVKDLLRIANSDRLNIRKLASIKAPLVTASIPDMAEIREKLMDGERLIEYYPLDEKTWACFVLSRNNHQYIELTDPRLKGLEQMVSNFRKAIKQVNNNAYQQPAAKLYDILIAPVMPYLGNAGKLTIVPHGSLHYLPFAALQSPNGYLIEKFSIRILPSSDILRYLEPNKKDAVTGTMILGNPYREKQKSLEFAEHEAKTINQILPHPTLRVGTGATLKFFNKQAHKHDKIHIAAHGLYAPKFPRQSKLLLTATDPFDNGNLTVADLFSLEPRLYSKLSVLSACDTGLSGIAKGDEIVGLQVAFLYAGSDSIISTLWPITDRRTADLMTDFYRFLEHQPAPDALRKAQLKMKGREEFSHPFYWAAFVFTGLAWQ